MKHRALRLESGNFSWGTEGEFKSVVAVHNIYACSSVTTHKTRILDVMYNASNNELVRTKTLVKNSIIQIDATPFKTWYEQTYGVKIGVKKGKAAAGAAAPKGSAHVQRKVAERAKGRTLDPALDEHFASGKVLACISSRPGQSGRCDGYILEGKELEFYAKMLKRKQSAK